MNSRQNFPEETRIGLREQDEEMTEGWRKSRKFHAGLLEMGYEFISNVREEDMEYWNEQYPEETFHVLLDRRAFHSDGTRNKNLKALFVMRRY